MNCRSKFPNISVKSFKAKFVPSYFLRKEPSVRTIPLSNRVLQARPASSVLGNMATNGVARLKQMTAHAVHPYLDTPFTEFPSRRSVVHSTGGMVACTQPLAAEAGQRILKMGGNAAVSL